MRLAQLLHQVEQANFHFNGEAKDSPGTKAFEPFGHTTVRRCGSNAFFLFFNFMELLT